MINLPSLAQRVGDIPLLAKHFLRIYCISHNKEKLGITDEALELMERYSWPGNIRELENVIERGVLLSKERYITADDLPIAITQQQNLIPKQYNQISLKESLATPEKNIIRQALEANHWNRQETARALDINRTTLFKKMKQYDLYTEAEKLGLT